MTACSCLIFRSRLAAKLVLVLSATLLLSSLAQATTYSFTKVADDSGAFFGFSDAAPAINSFGVVAFRAFLSTNEDGIFNGPNPVSDTIADDGGDYDFFSNPSINNAGDVTFRAQLDDGTRGVFTGPNPATDAVADEGDPYSGGFLGPSINNSGDVVFQAELDAGGAGIFSGPNPATDTLVDDGGTFDILGPPTLNDSGDVVFRSTLDGGGDGIFRFTASTSAVSTIANDTGPYSGFGTLAQARPSQNNGGDVAFFAALDAGGEGIFTGPDPMTDTVADTSGPFDSVDFRPSINTTGTVAFQASFGLDTSGVFTGPDFVFDAVIRTGDPLFGGTVDLVESRSESLNDIGQIAFRYSLEGGEDGVAIATPADVDLEDAEGGWEISATPFAIPFDDPEAHFERETLVVHESATDQGPFDLVIRVEDFGVLGAREIAVDKFLLNSVGSDISQVEFKLGIGTGDLFVDSELGDELYFVTKPEPLEETGAFPDVTMNDNLEPDILTFSGTYGDGETASFWVGIHVPDDLDGVVDRVSTFTLRQTVVPEPASWILLVIAVSCVWMIRGPRGRTISARSKS